jgi:hypothetical protein
VSVRQLARRSGKERAARRWKSVASIGIDRAGGIGITMTTMMMAIMTVVAVGEAINTTIDSS